MYNQIIIVFVGNYLGAFLNYLFHLISGRFLNLPQYSQLESLMTLTTLVAVFNGSFNPGLIKLFSNLSHSHLRPVLHKAESSILRVFAIQFVLLLLIYPLINSYLKIHNFYFYLLVVFQLSFTLFLSVYTAFFQAKSKFLIFVSFGIAVSLLKNIFTIIFSFLGLPDYAPYLSLSLSTIIVTIIARFIILSHASNDPLPYKDHPFHLWDYSILALFSNLGLVLAISLDIFLARYYFSGLESGVYSAVVVIGKIVYFTVSPFQALILPKLFSSEINTAKFTFIRNILILTAAICLVLIIGFNFFSGFITSLLYGPSYQQASLYIGRYAMFASLYAIFNIIILYLISKKNLFAAIIPLFTNFLQIIIFRFSTPTIPNLINSLLYSQLIGLCLSSLVLYTVISSSKRFSISHETGTPVKV